MKTLVRIITACLIAIFLAATLAAQTQGVGILLSKARSLEARGRMDLAAQNWKQVLLVNPNQTEAIAGLARYARQSGNNEEERGYLSRLKKINPRDPQIAAIENMHVLTVQEKDRLDEAGRLAMQHKPDEAMKIYNEVFGNTVPSGKWAEPYYETEAASSGGREKAISQLRRLCAGDPGNEIYRLWLARVLVNDPKTRLEGLQKLESLRDPGAVEQARTQWRQALLWEKENPAMLGSLNTYLQRYPDQELRAIQKTLQEKQEHMAEETSKERGFQALKGKDLSTAEARFQEVLRRSPNDANAVAGLAFVRLNQKRFDEAVPLFERALSLAPKRADVREGYDTAKFWSLMQQGSDALQHGQADAAITSYQQALALHPGNLDAMLGIAHAEVHEKKTVDAEEQFQQVLNQSPNNVDAIAGIAFLKVDQKKFDDAVALFDKARKLVPNRPEIEEGYKNAKYWSLMQHAATEANQNHSDAATSEYQQALALRPGSIDALHGAAGSAERVGNYAQAAQAYTQLTNANPGDAQSWLALLKVELLAKDFKGGIATSQRIPATVKPQIEARPDYLSQLALAYFSTKQADEGDRILDQAIKAAQLDPRSDSEEALNARLEVASALMEQGNIARALEIYQQATKLHPESAIAWEGLVGAYSRQHDSANAKLAVRSMPREAFNTAARNAGFLDSVAAVYAADGDCTRAEDLLSRSLDLDRAAGRQPRESTQLQLADIWLREQNYARASQAYREIVARTPNSAEAWRGYITALHNAKDDHDAVDESQRIPAEVRAELEKTSDFVVLLAGAHSSLGHNAETLQLLQKAQALYVTQKQTPPVELDLQLAWAMLNVRTADPRIFLQNLRERGDLTERQRAEINEIWSAWSVRTADEDLKNKKPQRAIATLTDAQRNLPNDPKIYAALASVYMREHDYQKALVVYHAWGLQGATADDYRAAVGTAIAAHKSDLAEIYLEQGLRNYPNDPGLLETKGKQAIARGNYNAGQAYLKSALRSARNPVAPQPSLVPREEPNPAIAPVGAGKDDAARLVAPSSSRMPACRQTTSYLRPRRTRLKLVSATYYEREDESQSDGGRNSGSQNDQASATPSNVDLSTALLDVVASGINPEPTPKAQERLQDEIDVVQNRNTPYSELGSIASGRAGDAGIDRLIIEDGVVGGSVTGGDRVRVSVLAHGLYLLSGTPDGGSAHLFGTLPLGSTFAQQSTGGLTGELQLSTATFGLDVSATPQSFTVSNLLGGLRFRPFGGPFTFMAVRDSVKDSLLSYAGVRDPGTGVIWGGVVSNTGTLQVEHKNRRAGGYGTVGFSYITGKNVPNNWNGFANLGFFVVVAKGLSIGVNGTGMHYDKNLSFFSLGQGGYFSPQQYGLASIPIDWFSRHKRFEYELRVSGGAQYISQDSSPFFPARINGVQPPQGFYASSTSTGPNYSFLARLGYRLASHAYFDLFATGGNARNYATQSVGFSLKILAHPLPTDTDLHVNSVPDWKGNQPFGIQ